MKIRSNCASPSSFMCKRLAQVSSNGVQDGYKESRKAGKGGTVKNTTNGSICPCCFAVAFCFPFLHSCLPYVRSFSDTQPLLTQTVSSRNGKEAEGDAQNDV